MTASAKPQMIGFWMTASLVVGTIIGSGIFMLPVSLAPLGRNALIGWIISGVGILCIAYALARLSRLGGDGIQANVEKEYGPTVAFLVAWSFWVSNWVAQAAVALAAAAALSFVSPSLGGDAAIVPMAIGWLVLLTAINGAGVRAAGSFSVVTVAIKLIPLLAVVFLFVERGVTGGTFEPFAPLPVNFANIATATALTFFAFTGFETATTPVGKVRNPERTIPRALIGGTAFVVLLYLVAGTAIQMLLPTSVVAASPAPFADALVSRWGTTAATVSALTVAVAAIGCLNGLILGTGELGYAMALRGEMPAAMTKTRGSNTPVVAQIVASVLSIILLLANSSRATAHLFTFIILLSTAAMVMLYLTSALAAWRCSPAPAQRLLIAGAVVFIAFATYGIGLEASLWCLVLLAIGLVVRAFMFRLNRRAAAGTAP
ncbi:APC family permease [Sphingosinicella microcystinivorans]|uniref:Arginine/agmatine antiporter n=1 Tax=Sphingosinicella microcystinivorans TaxID=335406 RepID=A0AAD1D6C6_SPHMI|nr:amino acid permease [Sphingosinicella microcystinivorans]RKS91721.1 amino acid/polyamine/organocation transporter (APC superfamily) [Sphingosinicella microcystinivorans]BBE34702.1 amino acid permease [Sphingosinicella microcystinivorans]